MQVESKPIHSLALRVYLSKRVLSICILTNSGPRLPLLFSMYVKKKGNREREICRCIANKTFGIFLPSLSFVLFLSQSIHHTAQLFCLCSHAHTSNIALFVVFTCFLFFIHLSNYALASKQKRPLRPPPALSSIGTVFTFFVNQ